MFEENGSRVKVLEEKCGVFGTGPVYHVNVHYSTGRVFFDGWVDSNFMPILFGEARDKKLISDDVAYPLEDFPTFKGQQFSFGFAKPKARDAMLDLQFQAWFDGGANCVSALAAFKQKIDDKHMTILACADNLIVGLIYGYDSSTRATGESFYIDYIFVHPNFRGMRIGDSLINLMQDVVTKLKFEKIEVLIQGKQESVEKTVNFNLRNEFKLDAKGVFDIGYGFYSVTMFKEL